MAYSTNLGLAQPTQGTLSGSWGNTVNDYITAYLDSAVAGTLTLSANSDVSLTKTEGTSLGSTSLQYAAIRWTASNGATTRTISVQDVSKQYIVINDGTGSIVLKISGQTGITITSGEQCVAAYNGTDFVKVASSLYTGTVTAVSVATANGFAGTSSGGATPALTLTTSVTGLVKGNGTALSAATANTDYLTPPSGTALLKANSGGALANATAGTDYVAPGTATTFTATQTFNGSSSTKAAQLLNAAETVNVVSAAPSSTTNFYVQSGAVQYYKSDATTNWTLNIAFSSGTSLATAMSVGDSITVAMLTTQGSTAYYNSALQIDGNAVTPKWQGGVAPVNGNANGIDSYTYTIIKTAATPTYTVLAAQTRFA